MPYDPTPDEKRVIAWLRGPVLMEALHAMLAAGMPGGTRTERTKRIAAAEALGHAVSRIAEGIEQGVPHDRQD